MSGSRGADHRFRLVEGSAAVESARRLDEPAPRDHPSATDPLRAIAPFVGRVFELEALRNAFVAVRGGAGCGMLLSGDPGIGKTRLLSEFAAAIAHDGAEVLWGRCWEGHGAPAFWPWTQVVRACLATASRSTLAASLGERVADLTGLVPEVAAWSSDPHPPQPSDPHAARFLVFDATVRLLRMAARERRVVVALDDLHRADVASLLLLQFLATELRTLPVLIVGTYRDLEPTRDDRLSRTIAALAREPLVGRLALRGLTVHETTNLVEHGIGCRAPLTLAQHVYERTRGNPLFVREIVQDVAGDPADPIGALRVTMARVPQTIREAIEHRLGRLAPDCRRVLEVAAVVGREFDACLLAQAMGVERFRVRRAMDAASAAGLVGPLTGPVDHYRFAHVLDRDVLYDDLAPTYRRALHRRIGDALELRATPDDDGARLSALALHFFEAARDGDGTKATTYALRAARVAVEAAAFEDAVKHYQRAVDTLRPGDGDDVAICEALLGLGDAQRRAGATEESRATFQRLAALARRKGRPRELARAALALGEPWAAFLARDDLLVALLEEALPGLAEGDTALRARVLAGLAWADSESPRTIRDERSQLAVRLAEQLGEPDTLLFVYTARLYATLSSRTLEDCIPAGQALLAASAAGADHDRAALAHVLMARVCLELADGEATWAHLEAAGRSATRGRLLRTRWRVGVARTMRALLEGRYDEAETAAFETYDLGRRSHEPIAEQNFHGQLFALRVEQGRIVELLPAFASVVAQNETAATWRGAWAMAVASTGDRDTARSILDHPVMRDPAAFTDGPHRLGALCMFAAAVAAVGDTERAVLLRDQLSPYMGRTVVIGAPCVCFGAVARYVGNLDALLERWTSAERAFEEALRRNAALGARPQIAITQADYASMLRARGGRGDGARADALVATARATAQQLGMHGLVERCRTMAQAEPLRPGDGRERNALRRDGAMWMLRFGGVVAHHKDLKGLHYIALLLRHPDTDVHAAVLATSDLGAAAGGNAVQVLGDCGPLLDARAGADVRRRRREVDDELRLAEAAHDLGRAAALRRESEFLDRELAKAFDRWGRPRMAASVSERARISVRNDIVRALRSIAGCHRALSLHLAASVKTGTFCSYRPSAPLVWDI